MTEMPVIFFARDFEFGHPGTFAQVCGEGALPASQARARARVLGPCVSRLRRRSRWCCRSV